MLKDTAGIYKQSRVLGILLFTNQTVLKLQLHISICDLHLFRENAVYYGCKPLISFPVWVTSI
jgi:hypothetical protein